MKLHLCNAPVPFFKNTADLVKFGGILGSVPIHYRWATPTDIAMVAASQKPVCLTFGPYQKMEAAKLRADDWGEVFLEDVRYTEKRLKDFAALDVRWVLVDIELWSTFSGDDFKDMTAKQQIMISLLGNVWPTATIILYSAGEVGPFQNDSGWQVNQWYMPNQTMGLSSCSLYYSEWALNQEIWKRSGCTIPFITLCGMYSRSKSAWTPYTKGLYPEWLYRAGFEINHPWCKGRSGYPLSAVDLVVLNLDDGWEKGFEIYCKI